MLDFGAVEKVVTPELEGLYGANVLKDMGELVRLYDFYDGKGQLWGVPDDLDYVPTRAVTNYAKKLIKAQARFMFGRPVELTVKAKDDAQSLVLQEAVNKVLSDNAFYEKLVKAGRDCFIGRRVAVKLWGGKDGIKIMFRPSLEFVFETELDEVDELSKIVFFYGLNDERERASQRVWKQKFEMVDGRCLLTEAVYDGYGKMTESMADAVDTGLDFIPAYVIINDGLSGDLNGESDIEEIMVSQTLYNQLTSDHVDTLKFNMFPVRVAENADGDSLKNMRIAPNALVDLQTEPALAEEGKSASLKILESDFSYAASFENTVSRVKNDMFELLGVPNVGLEQLRGLMQSGKSMQALYWELICKVEERWQAWDAMLRWLVDKVVWMCRAYGLYDLPDCPFTLEIAHVYPIMEDEEAERELDLEEVTQQVRSRKNYAEKWNINPDGNAELAQVAQEAELVK